MISVLAPIASQLIFSLMVIVATKYRWLRLAHVFFTTGLILTLVLVLVFTF